MQALVAGRGLQVTKVLGRVERSRSELAQFRAGNVTKITRRVDPFQTDVVTQEKARAEILYYQAELLWRHKADGTNEAGGVMRHGHPITARFHSFKNYVRTLPQFPPQPLTGDEYTYPVLVDGRRLTVAHCCDMFGLRPLDDVTERAFLATLSPEVATWHFCHLDGQSWTDVRHVQTCLTGQAAKAGMLTPLQGLFMRHYYPSSSSLSPQLLCFSGQQDMYFLLDGLCLRVVSLSEPLGNFACPTCLL